MKEIKCPVCGSTFKVDESDYALLEKSVRDELFVKELNAQKEALIEKHKAELESLSIKSNSSHSKEIENLKFEIQRLNSQLKLENQMKEASVKEAILEKDKALAKLEGELQLSKQSKTAAINEAMLEKENEITELKNKLILEKKQSELNANALKDQYDKELQVKEEQISFYKDLKAKLSTKMVGETLEQHCMNQFNEIRSAAFPNAYFEKDNDDSLGTKGDFIFREYDDNHVEILSIMFEMKNQNETTATKHKNEDFFKKLDKDRTDKNCEYAVLVSLLETDSELYNNGIVDVSYKYPKMYVIRPQFFIPLITILRNASLNAAKYKQELVLLKSQNIDISNFEENLMDFKNQFGKNFEIAQNHFNTAVDNIDKTINNLQKIRDELIKSTKQLDWANNKAQDLSIKKLTKNNPTMQALFEKESKK